MTATHDERPPALGDQAPGEPHVPAIPDQASTGPGEQLHPVELQAEDAGTLGEELDQAEEEPGTPGEERVRALAMPDLRPYADPRAVGKVAALGLRAGGGVLARRVWPRVRTGSRALARGAWLRLRIGSGVLLVLARAWMTGEVGGKVSPAVRLLAAPLLAVFGIAHTTAVRPRYLLVLLLAWLVGAPCAEAWARHRVQAEAKASRKGAAKSDGKGGGKGAGKGEEKEPAKASGKAGPRGLTGRLAALLDRPGKTPAEDAPEADDDAPTEALDQADEEAPAEAPPEPSVEDLAVALHALVGKGRGVLLTALSDHLQLPDTRAVKHLLDGAGIRWRSGVRTGGGNGPGVHLSDFPPLPPVHEDPQGDGVVAGHAANTNANNTAEKGFVAQTSRWTPAEVAQGYRWIPDLTRPNAWKIQHHPTRKEKP